MTGIPPRPVSIALLAIGFELGLAIVAVGLGWLLGYPAAAGVHWTPSALFWGAVGTLPLMAGSWWVSLADWAPLRRVTRELREKIIPLFARCGVLEFAAIAVAAGVGEELLFRGVLQRALAGAIGPLGGLVIASVLFGLAHLVTRTYAVLAGLVGLYLGGLFLAFDNLLVPIVVHALYDFVALVYLATVSGER